MPALASNPLPIQFTPFTKKHFETDAGIAFVNQTLSQLTTTINALLGSGGPTLLPSGIDVQGAKVTGLAAPESESDAVSLSHAQGNYSAPAVAPQLDLGGKNTLKGLAAVYSVVQPGIGTSTTLTLAKLTGGGSSGSITIKNGVVTAFTPPS